MDIGLQSIENNLNFLNDILFKENAKVTNSL